jgi:hypothetical protein
LFTCLAAARVASDDSPIQGGVTSNQITFQVAENKEDLQTRAPTPRGQARQKEKPKPDPRSEPRAQSGGGEGPKLGEPDRLPDAKRVKSLVKPLASDGPTIEKEIDVYDREEGGTAPPLPEPPPPPAAVAGRTFERRAEASILVPDLSPAERETLRRYFDRLRQEKRQ